MAIFIKMPKLGMEMVDAVVLTWFVNESDSVTRGQPVAEIETEKITHELQAPESGIVGRIYAQVNESRKVGEILAVITPEGEPFDEVSLPFEPPQAPKQPPEKPQPEKPHPPGAPGSTRDTGANLASPAARKLAREAGIDIAALRGTGPGGRIVERDVLAARTHTREHPAVGIKAHAERTRQVIATRLSESWKHPHIYLMAEVNAKNMVAFIHRQRAATEAKENQRPGYNDILIDVVAAAIAGDPRLHAVWGENRISIPEQVNIGLAVATEDGVIVPVIRQADGLSFREIVRQRADLANRARQQQLRVGETSGATFTISNLGTFDIDCFTAIINPPQTAILSVGKIKDTVLAVNGEIAVTPVLKVILGADHRVVDGATAAAFLQDVKYRLECYGAEPTASRPL